MLNCPVQTAMIAGDSKPLYSDTHVVLFMCMYSRDYDMTTMSITLVISDKKRSTVYSDSDLNNLRDIIGRRADVEGI